MRRLALAAALALSSIAEPAAAQVVAGVDLGSLAGESAAAAAAAMSTFAGLVTEANVSRMGFPDVGAVRKARVGVPFADFMVDLPRLAAFRAGTDPVSLLRPTQMVVYPLQATGGGQSSITLAHREGGWVAVSFGSPARTDALVRTREEMARRQEGRLGSYFQVRVAPLNLLFVGHLNGTELTLTPAFGAAEYGLASGRTVAASAIFARLSEVAARDRGGFR